MGAWRLDRAAQLSDTHDETRTARTRSRLPLVSCVGSSLQAASFSRCCDLHDQRSEVEWRGLARKGIDVSARNVATWLAQCAPQSTARARMHLRAQKLSWLSTHGAFCPRVLVLLVARSLCCVVRRSPSMGWPPASASPALSKRLSLLDGVGLGTGLVPCFWVVNGLRTVPDGCAGCLVQDDSAANDNDGAIVVFFVSSWIRWELLWRAMLVGSVVLGVVSLGFSHSSSLRRGRFS